MVPDGQPQKTFCGVVFVNDEVYVDVLLVDDFGRLPCVQNVVHVACDVASDLYRRRKMKEL